MQTFNMGRVPPVTFGAGRMSKVPDIVANLGGGPVLVIADAILADLGVTDRLVQGLASQNVRVDVAADVAGEPKETLIDALCARARDAGAQVIIGLGGGAACTAGLCGHPAHEPAISVDGGVGDRGFWRAP